MAEEHRRVAAETEVHARALADNLVNQGYQFVHTDASQWVLRRPRRRGDVTVTIAIAAGSGGISAPPAPPPVGPAWGPPTGPPVG